MGRVLHASYSGWFPNCLNNPDQIASFNANPDLWNLWVIRYPLEDSMFFYWVIKKLTFSFEGTDDTGAPFEGSFDIIAQNSSEESLVCSKDFQPSVTLDAFEYSAANFFGQDGEPDNIFISKLTFIYSDPGGRFNIYFGTSESPGGGYTGQTLTLAAGDYSYSFPIWLSPWATNTGEWGPISITAEEFFGYDGVWDTSTGQRL